MLCISFSCSPVTLQMSITRLFSQEQRGSYNWPKFMNNLRTSSESRRGLKKVKMFLVETLLNLVKSLNNKEISLCSLWARTAREDNMHSGQ